MNSDDIPYVLCLGVSYPSIKRTFERLNLDYPPALNEDTVEKSHDYVKTNRAESPSLTTSAENKTTTAVPAHSIKTVLDCVKNSYMTAMDGRDLARCLATEQHCRVRVYTVSQEAGALYEPDRHMWANFNRSSFVSALQRKFGDIQFQQVILDYFWIPSGWDVSHWKSSFFEQTLVNLARDNVLKPPPLVASGHSVSAGGAIYLPFCFHCFKEVVAHWDTLRQYYNLSFLRKGDPDLNQVALWAGTQQIDSASMQGILGKRRDQEEVYCSFGPGDVRGALDDPRVTKARLVDIARRLEDFNSIRFMALTRFEQCSMGQILGLVLPDQVQRGYDQMSTSASRMSAPTPLPITPLKRKARTHNIVSPSPSSPPPPQTITNKEGFCRRRLFSDRTSDDTSSKTNDGASCHGLGYTGSSSMTPSLWASRLRLRTILLPGRAPSSPIRKRQRPYSPVQEQPRSKRLSKHSSINKYK